MTGALLLLTLWAGELVDGHVHRAPHGGKIAHLGDGHLELRVNETELQVWLLDQRMRPLPPGPRSLRLTLAPKGRPTQTVVLTPAGDHLRATVDLTGLPDLQITAELRSGRRTAHASFRWTILDAKERIDDSDPSDGLKM
jgi:hypothetical protein